MSSLLIPDSERGLTSGSLDLSPPCCGCRSKLINDNSKSVRVDHLHFERYFSEFKHHDEVNSVYAYYTAD